MRSFKIRAASIFLAILIVFNPNSLLHARQFSLKRLFFATFGIYFRDEQKQVRHKNRVKQYKKKLQRQQSKIWPRKIYILGIDNSKVRNNIKLYFHLNKLEKDKKRLNLKDLKAIGQLIENSNKFDYVNVSFNYSPIGEEQIIIYIKMPSPFMEVTLVNKAANKLPYDIVNKAVEPLITAYFDNTALSRFSKIIKEFYKYLGYDYFFIRSYIIDNNKLTINMDEHRISQFSIIGNIYLCRNDSLLTKNLNCKIPLNLASQRFAFRKNGTINTNYADRAVESLKSDLIVDVCRYEIDYKEEYKVPLDICIFMTSLSPRSGFFSIYPDIISNAIFQLFEKDSSYNVNNFNNYYLDNLSHNNNYIESSNLLFNYLYHSNNHYLKLLKTNMLFDFNSSFIIDKIKNIIFAYYDLRNIIRKTDHLSLEIDFPYIDENFKIIYKDLWTAIGNKSLGITKFSLLSSKEMQDLAYFIGLDNLINKSILDNKKNNLYLVRQKLTKIEIQHKLFDFLSIYNKFGCLNKKHKLLEILNSDHLLYNSQLFISNNPNFSWIPRINKLSQIIYIFNWALIYHTMQDINSLYKGTDLYLDLINIYSDICSSKIKKKSPLIINLIKFKEVLFIPFSIDPELINNWSGLFTLNLNYILQNSKKRIARSNIFSYANMIGDKQVQDDFPSNYLSCEIHKRIRSNISIFGGLALEQSYFKSINARINTSRYNSSILLGFTVNIPIQDVQPVCIYYGIPIYGKTSKIGFKMFLYRSVYQNLNKQI